MDTMIELPAMRRSAELAPNTADADTRTVEVVWSAGARVRRATFFGEPYDEELSLDPAHVRLDRLNAGAPFLKVHELDTLDAVIGSVVPGSARIENGRGIALVRISERADVEPIWRDIQAGHIRAVSIGYQVHRFEVSKPEAARELWRAVDWTPFEVSAVAVGADPAAGFRAQHPLHDCVLHRRDAPTPQGASPMTDKTQTPSSDAATPATTQPTEPVETEDTTTTELSSAAPDPKVAASEMRSQPKTQATPAPDTEAVATRAREAERDRVSTIYDLAGRLNLERGFAEDLVKRGVSVDESRRLILDQVAAKSDETRTFPHVSVPLGGRDERITRRDAVANALLHRYSPTLFQLEDAARQYRGMTLLELARESLGNAGVNTRGLSRDEVATRALHSTSDFPEILSAVTNKTLRQAYEAYPRTFALFCRQVLATDFKSMHRVQLGEAPQLLEVGESGEFKRGTLGESKESYKVKTYGRVVAITRQVLINDDLDAFTRIPAMYGNSIAQLESDVVWSIITANPAMADGTALFHANHKNLAGTGAALAVDAVGAARAAMALQTGLDKKTVLNIRPAFLIVPAALELKAEQLVAQNLVPAATSSVVPQSIRTLSPISEPRLDAASATAWYLAASPNQIDTIEYAYLEGQQGAYPDVESLWRRAGVHADALERLAEADAFAAIGLNRRDSLWAAKALKAPAPLPLFGSDGEGAAEPDVKLPQMTLVIEDYLSLRLSLRAHPMELLRPRLTESLAHDRLPQASGRITVTGLVITRQRPGTASGVIFLTLEDETGTANVVVWKKVYETFRKAVIAGRLVSVTGRIERDGPVTHLIAERVEDVSPLLATLGRPVLIPPNDGRADETRRPTGGSRRPTARHPREQARKLFPSRDFH